MGSRALWHSSGRRAIGGQAWLPRQAEAPIARVAAVGTMAVGKVAAVAAA
jgi:hypothetical protein